VVDPAVVAERPSSPKHGLFLLGGLVLGLMLGVAFALWEASKDPNRRVGPAGSDNGAARPD